MIGKILAVVAVPLLVIVLILLFGAQQFVLEKLYAKEPETELITVNCDGNKLTLGDVRGFSSGSGELIGKLYRKPLLRFNSKLVSDPFLGRLRNNLDMGIPFNPKDREKLVIKKYHSDSYEQDWSVYVNPKEFSSEEFSQFISCYETNRSLIDGALANSTVDPWWMGSGAKFNPYTQRIVAIVYGEMPKPQFFTTTFPRSALPELKAGNVVWDVISPEIMTIQVNGNWIIEQVKAGSYINSGNGIIGEDLKLKVNYLDEITYPRNKGMTDREYFNSFVNSEGKKLLDYYEY